MSRVILAAAIVVGFGSQLEAQVAPQPRVVNPRIIQSQQALPQPNEEQQRLVDALQAHGAVVEIDPTAEEWVLREVDFDREMGNDEGLALLKDQTTLQSISCYDAKVTNEGLKSLSGLRNLESLMLHAGHVNDEGLKHLAGLVKLNSLNLWSCDLNGQGLAALTHLPVRQLTLNMTMFDDNGMAALGRMPSLETVSLWGTFVTDAGLVHLEKLRNLQSISFREAGISDEGLKHLAGADSLRSLTLRGSLVEGPGLEHLKGLPRLSNLDVSRTKVGDESLKHLMSMESLASLDVELSKITRTGLRELWRVNPGIEVQGVELMEPGDETEAAELLRAAGDEAIADRRRRLLESSSPHKREVIEQLLERDELVQSYRFDWKQTRRRSNGTKDNGDDQKDTATESLTVDGNRFASDREGILDDNTVWQMNTEDGNIISAVTSRFLNGAVKMVVVARFDGEQDQSLTRFLDTNAVSVNPPRWAGRTWSVRTEQMPVLWMYSTFDPAIVTIDWRRVEVLDEQEEVDGRPCIVLRLEQEVPEGFIDVQGEFVGSQETWWIDPSRDHAFVRYTLQYGGQPPMTDITVRHQESPAGWAPSEWTIRTPQGETHDETKVEVIDFELNPETSAEEFTLELPSEPVPTRRLQDENE